MYANQGWENGALGFPTGKEWAKGNGYAQNFEGGTLEWNTQDWRRKAAVDFAYAQLGDAYQMGGNGPPDVWDCSGLTSAAMRAAGISVPRTSQQQYYAGRKIPLSELQPGDLVVYYSGLSHVASTSAAAR